MFTDLTLQSTRRSDSVSQAYEDLVTDLSVIKTKAAFIKICLQFVAVGAKKKCFEIADRLVHPFQIVDLILLNPSNDWGGFRFVSSC